MISTRRGLATGGSQQNHTINTRGALRGRWLAALAGVLLCIPLRVQTAAAHSVRDSVLPTLPEFVAQVSNSGPATLRGVYAAGVFALPVVEQPPGNDTYVSSAPHTLTQFRDASQFGVTALLAHNYLSGAHFFELQAGQRIYLVFGDGHVATYVVGQILKFRALQPSSPATDFIALSSQARLSAPQLFDRVYTGPEHVTLQTCIANGNSRSWGRLFVLAFPPTHDPPEGPVPPT